VIAVAGATLDASDGAIGVDRGDDVFTNVFALPTIRVHVATDLGAFNDTERILRHYFDSVSIFNHPLSGIYPAYIRQTSGHPGLDQAPGQAAPTPYSSLTLFNSPQIIRSRIDDWIPALGHRRHGEKKWR
jgi:hypothetical protein